MSQKTDVKHSSACRRSFAFWKGLSPLSRYREHSSNRLEFLSFRASGGISRRRSDGPFSTVMCAVPSLMEMVLYHLILSRHISRSVPASSRLHKSLAFPPGNSSISVAGRHDNSSHQMPPAMRSNIPRPLNRANHLRLQSSPAYSSDGLRQQADSLLMKKEAARQSRVERTCNGCSRRLDTK